MFNHDNIVVFDIYVCSKQLFNSDLLSIKILIL